MAEITGNADKIESGVYGRDIREPIHDALAILHDNPPGVDTYEEKLVSPREYTTLETKNPDLLYLIKDEGIPLDETLVSLVELDEDLKAVKVAKTYQSSNTGQTWTSIRDIALANPDKNYMIYFGWNRTQYSSYDSVYGSSSTASDGGYLRGLSNIKKFVANNQTEYINSYSFQDTGLEELVLYRHKSSPNYYTALQNSSFAGTKLKKIDLTCGVCVDYNGQFVGCPDLEEVSLLCNTRYLGSNMFKDCTKLKKVTILLDPDLVSDRQASIASNMFQGCTSLTDLELDDRLYYIDQYAFNGCTSLASITIPRDVYYLGSYSFTSCSNLKTVYMNSEMLYLNTQVFAGDTKLENVVFPADSKITNINDQVFAGCTGLHDIHLPGSMVSYISSNAFTGCQNITIRLDIPYDESSSIAEQFPFGATNATLVWGDGHIQTS